MNDRQLTLKTHRPEATDSYLVPKFLIVDQAVSEVVAGFYDLGEALRAFPRALPAAEFHDNDELRRQLTAARHAWLAELRAFFASLDERTRTILQEHA